MPDYPRPVNGEPGISLSAFARHRSVTLQSVTRAVKKGRLRDCLVARGDRMYITDVALADKEWVKNANHTTTPASVLANGYGGMKSPTAAKPPPAKATPAATPPVRPMGATSRRSADDEIPEVTDTMTLTEASAIEKQWKGRLAKLEYEKKAGTVIDAGEVETKMTDVFAAVRTKLLGVPVRCRQRLPHLSADDVVVIEDLVREALEELSNVSLVANDEDE